MKIIAKRLSTLLLTAIAALGVTPPARADQPQADTEAARARPPAARQCRRARRDLLEQRDERPARQRVVIRSLCLHPRQNEASSSRRRSARAFELVARHTKTYDPANITGEFLMRTKVVTVVACCAAAVLLGGCGTTYSLKEFSPTKDGPKTALIDIKQRAILSSARKGTAANSNDVVTCAEPSPDALSSLASEFALDTKVKDSLQATLGFSQQEAASFVGLRTQTIQLLRDGMYRLCEGYMSGALTQPDYAWLSRRYQRNMVALLTIEQLTRVAQAPTVAQASEGMASASRSAAAIQADLEEVDKVRTRLNDEKKKIADEKVAADKLPETDTAKADKLKDIQARLDDKQAAIARTDEVRTAMLDGLKSAKGVLTSGRTTVQVVAASNDTRATLGSDVVTAISRITTDVITQDDLPTLCFQLLDGSRGTSNGASKELKDSCTTYLVARANQEAANAELARKKAAEQSSSIERSGLTDTRGPIFLSKEPDKRTTERLKNLFGNNVPPIFLLNQ
jgi:hypothetical protein